MKRLIPFPENYYLLRLLKPLQRTQAESRHRMHTQSTQPISLVKALAGFEDVGAKVPYEMVRDAKLHGGEDTLISRKRHAVSVAVFPTLRHHRQQIPLPMRN